jgi:hypothetical protein
MPPAPRHDPAEAPATLVLTDTPEHHEGDPVQSWDWVDRQEAPSGLQPKEP